MHLIAFIEILQRNFHMSPANSKMTHNHDFIASSELVWQIEEVVKSLNEAIVGKMKQEMQNVSS